MFGLAPRESLSGQERGPLMPSALADRGRAKVTVAGPQSVVLVAKTSH